MKKRNLIHLFIGYVLVGISMALWSFFLPYYLKEEGWGILLIGTFLTLGLAIGSLITGLLFSRIQKRITLKRGLKISSVFAFLVSVFFFAIPNYFGLVFSNIFSSIEKTVFKISTDVTMQHNSSKKNHREVSAYSLIADSVSIIFGVILAIFLIKWIGFINSLLVFSLFAILSTLFFNQVKEETRFKIKKQGKFPNIGFDLKLILLSEILYWLGLASSFSLVITFLVTGSFGGGIEWIAILFIVLYSSITITTLLTRKFVNKLNLFKSSIFGMFILLISALVIIFSRNLYFVAIAMILEGIGAGIWVPSKVALYWGRTKPELRESVSGYLNGFRVFASTAGPLVGGFLVFYFGILAPFYFKAVIALLSIMIYVYLLIKK